LRSSQDLDQTPTPPLNDVIKQTEISPKFSRARRQPKAEKLSATQTELSSKQKSRSCNRWNHKPDCQCHEIYRAVSAQEQIFGFYRNKPSEPMPLAAARWVKTPGSKAKLSNAKQQPVLAKKWSSQKEGQPNDRSKAPSAHENNPQTSKLKPNMMSSKLSKTKTIKQRTSRREPKPIVVVVGEKQRTKL